jgi:periplasmic protein TonB
LLSILKPPDRPEPYAAKAVDSEPVVLNHVWPRYTDEARNNQVQGTVTVRMLVDETGTVTQVRVVRSLPFGLTEKAIEAAREVKFKPAMKDGKAVPYWLTLQLNFSLR